MSGKSKPDPRARRTRDVLGDALVALIQQKPFDDITVQNLLDRAGVSQSTFYTHYADKQDLFLSDLEDFFDQLSTLLTRRNAPAHRIAPVQEFFAHLQEVAGFHAALVASGKTEEIRELGIGYFARSMEQRLRNVSFNLPDAQLRPTAHALAGALFSLLDYWLATDKQHTPEQMDTLFHNLIPRLSIPSRE